MISRIHRPYQRIARRIRAFWAPLRLGVRALVVDPEQGVLLVRHTYVEG